MLKKDTKTTLAKESSDPMFQGRSINKIPLLAVHLVLISACNSVFSPDRTTGNTALSNESSHGELPTGLLATTSFDVYSENNRLHILTAGKSNLGKNQQSLRYLFSDDGGYLWSQSSDPTINQPGTLASRGNDVQIASYGDRLLALWQTQGELPGMGPLVSAHSADGGKTWQPGVNPAANQAGDQSHADLIADNAGNFHAVWLEDPEENGYQSLRYANSNSEGVIWSTPKTLDDSTCSCCWNTLARSTQGQLAILYRDMKPRDMALLQSDDAGQTWKNAGFIGPFNWQFDGCPHTGGALAYAPSTASSALHGLVWTGADNRQGLYYLNTQDGGKTWVPPRKMGNIAIHADIASFDDRHIAAVWDEMGPEGSSVVFSESGDGGNQWSPPQTISQAANNGSHPRIVATATGYLALWTEKPPKQAQRLVWFRPNKQID